MREIKYRAWAKHSQNMVRQQEGTLGWFEPKCASASHKEQHVTLNHVLTKPDEFIAMQYTGLKDVDGTEIYEGDIVEYTRTNIQTNEHHDKLVFVGQIYWNEDDKAYRFYHKFKGGGAISSSLSFNDNRAEKNIVKVIGNVYENPELLEHK